MSITETVKLYHQAGFAGQVGDLQTGNNVSKVNTTENVLPAGTAVVRDGQDGVKPFAGTNTAADFLGVVVRTYNDVTLQGKEIGINPQRTGSVRTMGTIWVVAGEAITAGDAAYIGTGTDVVGKFMKQAGSTTTLAVALTGCKYLTDAAKAGDVVLLSMNIGG